jgi:hypothetical protein
VRLRSAPRESMHRSTACDAIEPHKQQWPGQFQERACTEQLLCGTSAVTTATAIKPGCCSGRALSHLGHIALKVLHLHNAIEQNTRSSNASQCGSHIVQRSFLASCEWCDEAAGAVRGGGGVCKRVKVIECGSVMQCMTKGAFCVRGGHRTPAIRAATLVSLVRVVGGCGVCKHVKVSAGHAVTPFVRAGVQTSHDTCKAAIIARFTGDLERVIVSVCERMGHDAAIAVRARHAGHVRLR